MGYEFFEYVCYKNLDLTVDLRVVFGNKVFNRTKMTLENRSGIANSLASVLNCWSPQNQSSMIAERRPTTAYSTICMMII